MPGNSWSPEEEMRLRELYPASTDVRFLARLFQRSPSAVKSRAKVLRLKKAKFRKVWTAAEDKRLRELYPHRLTRELAVEFGATKLSVHQRANKLGIHKSAAFMAKALRDCGIQVTESGKAHRFPKGHVSANKGVKMPGWGPGRMKETQFKKGQVSINTMPMWSFRWVDGYLMLKTGKRHAPPNDRWEYVHKLIWEQANGPLPDWRVARLWWKDGDHSNCALSNLELVNGWAHAARTSIHNLPAPLKQVIQLKGALKRRIRRMEREHAEEHDGRSPQPPVCDDRSLAG
jgi:hypothetical protein